MARTRRCCDDRERGVGSYRHTVSGQYIVSGIALIWAANVKGLRPSSKVVLIQLADFHNKETGQCNPSAQRLADECEMGRSTVFRHLTDLEEFGLIERSHRGNGKGGRGSSQYNLKLDIVLGASSKHKVKSQIGTGTLPMNLELNLVCRKPPHTQIFSMSFGMHTRGHRMRPILSVFSLKLWRRV